MGDYKDDMTAEKKPSAMFPEGHRQVRVLEMMEGTSKSGNRMFITTLEDVKTKANMTVYLVAEPKKRWMLKSLLSAVAVPAGADGIYDWSTTDVIGQVATAIIEHYQEPWINREGIEVMANKSKVTEFLSADKAEVISEEDIAWDEK